MNYGDAAGFAAYHEARGRDVPGTWDSDVINAALLAASEWIDGIYGPSFVGYRTGGYSQERAWPRTAATIWFENAYFTFGVNDIPDRVKNATYEAAYRHATSPGSLQVDYTPGKYKRVSIDGALSVEYAQFSSSADIQTQIGAVDTWLWPLLDPKAAASFSGLSGDVSRV